MALGDSNRNGNSNKLYENTYYSRFGIKDYILNSGKRFGISYKSGMMIFDISKEKDGGFSFESIISVYITITKAKILLEQIRLFKEELKKGLSDPNKGFGINTGMGEIQTILAFHVTADKQPAMMIGKINADGEFTAKEDFVFNTNDFHYGLQWDNIDKMKFKKDVYNNIELDMLETAIESFAVNMNGAIAYSVADLTRYDTRSILNKMNPIYDKLGIERQNFGSSRGNSNPGFFNGGGTSNHKDFESVSRSLMDEDED